MKIVNTRPPMYDEIVAAFPGATDPGVIFCWGDTIHTQLGAEVVIPEELIAHEAVHCERQGADVAAWWRHYIADERFRLIEEFPAHVAELQTMCRIYRHKWVSARAMTRHFAGIVAKKLAAPLYGEMLLVADAKELLLKALRTGEAVPDAD